MIDVDLDHVGLATADLDRARAAYERLGFRLTRRSSHSGPVGEDGAVGPWGTGNHCAMFRRGYFELIGITDAALYHDHVAARLARYGGLHLIALGCADGHGLAKELGSRLDGVATPYDFSRDVPHGDGAREGGFRIVQLDNDIWPDGDLFFIQHLSREVLWQPDLLDHPNGVSALAGVTICVADLAASRARIAALLDGGGAEEGGEVRFGLRAGWLALIDEATLAARYSGVTPPVLPWVAAVSFEVAERRALADLLAANGVRAHQSDGALWVAPDDAEGAVVEFR
jgi:catechol 2,3-dioxygenase-like lactoylglutathione lyase family enzyme